MSKRVFAQLKEHPDGGVSTVAGRVDLVCPASRRERRETGWSCSTWTKGEKNPRSVLWVHEADASWPNSPPDGGTSQRHVKQQVTYRVIPTQQSTTPPMSESNGTRTQGKRERTITGCKTMMRWQEKRWSASIVPSADSAAPPPATLAQKGQISPSSSSALQLFGVMARTRQSARQSTGATAPRRALGEWFPSPEYSIRL